MRVLNLLIALAACALADPACAGCVFSVSAAPMAMTIDRSQTSTVSASTPLKVACTGGAPLSWLISGAYASGPSLLMKNRTSNEYLPYSVGVAPLHGGGGGNWMFTATILPSAYRNVSGGSYADLVTISIAP